MKKAFPVLKRGESALVTKRKHIPTWLFKQSVDLTRQQQAIEKAVSEIGVLNAGKKRDEILEMVGPYFSRLERHLGQMKKYQATIDYLTQENEGLKEKVNSEKSIQKPVSYTHLDGGSGVRCGMHPASLGRKTGWVFVTVREQKACPFSESGGKYISPRPPFHAA